MPVAATTNVTRVCGRCGSKLFADAPQGFCSLCLFKAAVAPLLDEALVESDDGGSKDSAKIPSEFGDYELLDEVGRGGQGVVYRARQKSLNRTVALKVIGLGIWATEVHLKRFRREAEAAARLQHPGIVPIHEVGERDSQCYFSMDFIEGGQLDEVVKRSPLPIRQAVELVARLARIVHYAHEHGILHRDIKPGNILLDTTGEPHLTDFGLARLIETESTLTRTKDLMGTPSYMAPEQAIGNNDQITRGTDVYGLGAVLYQLLTGDPPFAGGTTYETIKLLLDAEPKQPRLLNPKVDRDLSTICLKCLEKDPKRRYPSALALAEDLEHWLKHEPIVARHSGAFIRGGKWVRRNPTTALLSAALITLAAVIGWNIWKSESIRPPITNGIAVLPFENLSADPDNAYFAEGIQDEILTRLAKIADLKVISRTSTQHYQNKPRNLAEIAKQLGVANVLEGSVQKVADQVRVNVQLINAQTDAHLWAEGYDRKLTDILGVESEIAKGIAESLQAKLSGREEQALAAKPTNNPEAYDAYLRGLAFQGRFISSFYTPDLALKAAGFYERAVQLDPNFTIAWARLSRINSALYRLPPLSSEGARRALENAQRLEPNSPETLLALGYYQLGPLQDYGVAETTFNRVSKMLPGNSEVAHALADVTQSLGQWDQSVAYFEQALALDPRNVELLNGAAATYAMLRQFPSALKLYDRVLDITPYDPNMMAAQAGIYQAQGNLEKVAESLPETNWQTCPWSTFLVKIVQLRLERNYSEAGRLLQTRLTQFHYTSQYAKARDQLTLASIQRLAGDTAGAKLIAEQACNTLESLSRVDQDDAAALSSLAQTYAVMDEKTLALSTAERAVMILSRTKDAADKPAVEENLALIQTMFGENSRAISTLTRLLQTPYDSPMYHFVLTPALLRLDPIWDPLRGDQAFQKLCEEKRK